LGELLGGFNGSGVGRRIRITDGKAFLVPSGLGEYASRFDFQRMRGLAVVTLINLR
jgi:hypothetical protein